MRLSEGRRGNRSREMAVGVVACSSLTERSTCIRYGRRVSTFVFVNGEAKVSTVRCGPRDYAETRAESGETERVRERYERVVLMASIGGESHTVSLNAFLVVFPISCSRKMSSKHDKQKKEKAESRKLPGRGSGFSRKGSRKVFLHLSSFFSPE